MFLCECAEGTEVNNFLSCKRRSRMRVEDSKKSCTKHQNRIKMYLPPTGEVRMLILTERQFADCVLCQEKPDLQEKLVGAKDLVTL